MVGDSHRELIVAGPAATATTVMESAAERRSDPHQPGHGRTPAGTQCRQAAWARVSCSAVRSTPTTSEFEPAQPKPELDQFLARGLQRAVADPVMSSRSIARSRSDSFTSWISTT